MRSPGSLAREVRLSLRSLATAFTTETSREILRAKEALQNDMGKRTVNSFATPRPLPWRQQPPLSHHALAQCELRRECWQSLQQCCPLDATNRHSHSPASATRTTFARCR